MDKFTCPLKKIYPQKKKRAEYIIDSLEKIYPDTACGLHFENDPFRLLVMARLSAQCTDKRVNTVSAELFSKFPDAKSMSEAPVEEIENLVRSCGVYRMKAKNIKDMSKIIYEKYNSAVPCDMELLLELPGVGRKIANLIRGDVFGIGGIVADTHCIRISHRWGLTTKPDPLTTERELSRLIPPEKQSDFCHRVVDFGREYCSARGAKCDSCPLVNQNNQ
ncbi:MAG: endonuclease III [Clostridia bacterium]|nr:endonuclease III [Clostridia bacterium]